MDIPQIERALRAGPLDEPRYDVRPLAAVDVGPVAADRTAGRHRPTVRAAVPALGLGAFVLVAVLVVGVLLQAGSFAPAGPRPTPSGAAEPCTPAELAARVIGVTAVPAPGAEDESATVSPFATSRSIDVAIWRLGDGDCEIPSDMRTRIVEVGGGASRILADSVIEAQVAPVSMVWLPPGARYSGNVTWWSHCNGPATELALEVRLAEGQWMAARYTGADGATPPLCLALEKDADLLPLSSFGTDHPPLPPHLAPPADLAAPTTARLTVAEGEPLSAEAAAALEAVIHARLAARGWAGTVTLDGDAVEVAAVGVIDEAELLALLGRGETTFLAPPAGDETDVGEPAPVGTLLAGPDEVLSVTLADDAGATRTDIVLADAAARRLADFSRDNVGGRFLVVIDGLVVSAPIVMSPVQGGAVTITGGDVAFARRLAAFVNGGRLPVALEVSRD